jgi:hypothetical protein
MRVKRIKCAIADCDVVNARELTTAMANSINLEQSTITSKILAFLALYIPTLHFEFLPFSMNTLE